MMEDRNMKKELVALEQVDPELTAERQRRIIELMERKLRPVERISWLLVGVLGIAFFLGFGFVAVYAPSEFPWWGRAGFVSGSLFGMLFAVLAVSIIRRGKIIRNRHPNAAAGLGWAVVVIQFSLLFMFGQRLPDCNTSTWMMFGSLGFLVMGAAFLTKNQVEQSALKAEEQFLRLELQLADLTAKVSDMKQPQSGEPGSSTK